MPQTSANVRAHPSAATLLCTHPKGLTRFGGMTKILLLAVSVSLPVLLTACEEGEREHHHHHHDQEAVTSTTTEETTVHQVSPSTTTVRTY
jgi:hypothetical protein